MRARYRVPLAPAAKPLQRGPPPANGGRAPSWSGRRRVPFPPRPNLPRVQHRLQRRVVDGEREVDAGAAAAGFVGGEDHLGGAEGFASGELRLAVVLEAVDQVGDAAVDGLVAVDTFGGVDVMPVRVAAAAE